MDVALQRRVLDAFDAALTWPEEEREARLREAAQRDPALAAQLDVLLRGDAKAHRALPTEPPAGLDGLALEPPTRIGPYRLTALLGEGGMGAVWRGERDDGLFEHVVAIKLIRPGRTRASVSHQFDTERRVLARLHHPAIARLFDGGTDEEGRAWFVMELVAGVPLVDHVRRRGLNLRQAVALLLPVCAAVQHAHQALVVHADLKPGNILIDEESGPKLLDFGIARNLQEAETEGAPAGGLTLAYASPELRTGERPRPADDVYALGCILYELASGSPPQAAPPAAVTQGGPEFAAVVAKATAADPHQRYASAGELAADLQRWLDGRPVRARAPSRRRAAAMFARRRPLATLAGVAAAVSLVGALASISALYVEARQAREAAEQRYADVRGLAHRLLFELYDRLEQTPRSLELRRDLAMTGQEYLNRLVAAAHARDDVQVEAARGYVRLAEIQAGARTRNLGQVPEARANLVRAIALAAQIDGGPEKAQALLVSAEARLAQSELAINKDGDAAASERLLDASRRDLAAAGPGAGVEGAELAIDQNLALSALRQWQGRYPESLRAAAQAMAAIDRRPAGANASPQGQRLLARALDAEAETRSYAGDQAGSLASYQREYAALQAVNAESPDDPITIRALARAGWALGVTLLDMRQPKEAEPLLAESVGLAKDMVGFDPQDALARRTLRISRMAYAQVLAAEGRTGEALRLLTASVEERRRLSLTGGPEALREYAIAADALGDVQRGAGMNADACRSYSVGLATFAELKRRRALNALDLEHPLAGAQAGEAATCPAP